MKSLLDSSSNAEESSPAVEIRLSARQDKSNSINRKLISHDSPKGRFPLQRIWSREPVRSHALALKKKQSDWFSLILVAKKLNLIQLPDLTARSPVNARF